MNVLKNETFVQNNLCTRSVNRETPNLSAPWPTSLLKHPGFHAAYMLKVVGTSFRFQSQTVTYHYLT